VFDAGHRHLFAAELYRDLAPEEKENVVAAVRTAVIDTQHDAYTPPIRARSSTTASSWTLDGRRP
jgi:hypothetical protein